MVRCKLPGAEWSGNILNKRKMHGEKLFRQLLFFDRKMRCGQENCFGEKRRLALSHWLTSFGMSTIINTERIRLVYQVKSYNLTMDFDFIVEEEEE